MKAIYKNICPNCGGDISDVRLKLRNPCEKCIEEVVKGVSYHEILENVSNQLVKNNRLGMWGEIWQLYQEEKSFEEFFKTATGFSLWNAQISWVRRLLRQRSFSIVAPTGMGKSVFGIVVALYFAMKGKKSYIIVPTTGLVKQTVKRVKEFLKKLNLDVKVVYYYSEFKKDQKEKVLKEIEDFNFDVLITTSQYLNKNFKTLYNKTFDYIFVDDVDAFLKASKNVEYSIKLLGFNEEMIKKAWQLVKFKMQLAKVIENKLQAQKIIKKIEELNEEIKSYKSSSKVGVLIIASATGTRKGEKVKLYRELLGFEVGSGRSTLRNIVDVYVKLKSSVNECIKELLLKLGKGGLVFVASDYGLEKAVEIVEYLKSFGFKIDIVSATNRSSLEEFEVGNLDYLVGVATYYGSIVRGVDLPHKIRYAVFVGVPKFKFEFDLEKPSLFMVFNLLEEILDFLEGKDKHIAEKVYIRLKKAIKLIPSEKLEVLEEILSKSYLEKSKLKEKNLIFVYKSFVEAVLLLKNLLSQKDVFEKLERDPYISIDKSGDKIFIKIPDSRTYIQASGRVSRLFTGGVTKGLSLVVVDDEKILSGLSRQMRWYLPDFEFKDLKDIDLKKIIEEIDEDRKKLCCLMKGELSSKLRDLVKSVLLIVESPNKAKTIVNFFGQPTKRNFGSINAYEICIGNIILTVIASGGHIFDLTTNLGYHGVLMDKKQGRLLFYPVYDTIKRCRSCGYQFVDYLVQRKCPKCGVEDVVDVYNNVKALIDLAQEVDEILIGTDPDTEGEKIACDLMCVLSPYAANIKRIEFHEVTKSAILNAIRNPREVDENKATAQIVRRVEDRWIGFELSQQLWRVFKNNFLSAGRVQVPVLGWVIERYAEYLKNKTNFLKLELEGNISLTIEIEKPYFGIKEVKVKQVNQQKKEIKPLAPYTTDTLLYDASFLGFSADYTMRLAQDLFELGLITYIRTDSTHVSLAGLEVAKEYITKEIGQEYLSLNKWGEEGTHECIRPTRALDTERLKKLIFSEIISLTGKLTNDHFKLYNLIFERFIASQMKAALILYQKAILDFAGREVELEGYIDVIFDGFSRIRKLNYKKLPKLSVGQVVRILNKKFYKASKVQLYSQGEIIAVMKERKIGRPSTYAKIVRILLDRGYVFEDKNKLIPTKLGQKVYFYLLKRYKDLISEQRTRYLEELMDLVEENKLDYQEVLNNMYSEIKNYVSHKKYKLHLQDTYFDVDRSLIKNSDKQI